MEDKAAAQKEKPAIPVLLIVTGIVLLLGAGGFFFLSRQSREAPLAPVLTGDARAYVRSLKLSEVEIKAHESYLKQAVTEITGKIGNEGNRVLKLVEINCVFTDAYGQVVLRERVAIVKQKLSPGDMQSFRLAFDNIPGSWNQAMPTIVIASIDFASA